VVGMCTPITDREDDNPRGLCPPAELLAATASQDAKLSVVRMATAIGVAGVVSGVPSTIVTIRHRGEVLASTRAAGSLLASGSDSPTIRLLAGATAHVIISSFWGSVLWCGLPRHHTLAWGAVGGLGIAALDLGIVARRYPAIRRLPRAPQVADHVAFGLIVGGCRAYVRGRPNPAGTLPGL
jgi:hypothetical protein